MRTVRQTLAILLGMSGVLILTFASSCAQNAVVFSEAEIKVFPSQPQGEISPLLYGASVEWTENGNRILDSDHGQLRPEVMNLLKPLHIPVWRFPGGILSDYYHWHDGIGPRGERPKRFNPMDQSTHENNFGTDEFIEFSEPKEHSSIPGNDRRIYKSAQQYSSGFREWSEALRSADREAQVGAIAGTYNTSPQNSSWLNPLLSGAASDVDFIALHNAFAPLIFGRYDYKSEERRDEAYQAMFAQAMFSAEDTRRVQQLAASTRSTPPKIAITEHFPLFGGSPDQLMAILDQSRTLASALYTSSLFHAFMREHVWMANYNIAVSKWFGALLTDTDSGIIKTPTYHVFDLYRNHFGNTLINVQTSSPLFSTKQVGTVKSRKDVPYLDAVASTGQGNIYLAVINRNLSQAMQARVSVEGLLPDAIAELTTLAGSAPNAINGASLSPSTQGGPPDFVTLQQSESKGVNRGEYAFPPASITVFKWQAAQPRQKK